LTVRVLHVSAYYAPAFVYGGPPRSIHGLCRALSRCGVNIGVFTTDANGAETLPLAAANAIEYEGVPVRYFPRSWPARPIGSRHLAAALRASLAGMDVLHIHGLWNRVVWAAARQARRAAIPYVLSPRGMLEEAALTLRSWRKRAAFALVERKTVDGAALLHATSERELQTLRRLRPTARVTLIPNGIEFAASTGRRVARTLFGLPPSVPIVLFVGRLHPIKRLDLLIDAFIALKEHGSDAHLVIAGPDETALRHSLATRAARVEGAITWVGPVDDVRRDALMREAAALVMCSDSESFGLTALEAMANGVPVVITRTCAWADVARHRTGYWVDQRADEIADALRRLLGDPDAARAMGARGVELVQSKYTWDAIARAFLREYETVVSESAASTLSLAL
jgi:glycosyltransferase involved in cell wall biosynthesis